MKLKTPAELNLHKTDEIIGFLGSTQLVRRHNGIHELIGGTLSERMVARLWCECFAPDMGFADSYEFSRLQAAGI